MGRIYYIMGKSATGKDTVYKEILKRSSAASGLLIFTMVPSFILHPP